MGNTSGREKEHKRRYADDSGPTLVGKHYDGSTVDGVSTAKTSDEVSGHRHMTHDVGDKKLPTVFKWDGGGKQVYISGSFDNWKAKIPLVRSHGDFYTIIDLSEGEHQYKFLVDGQWQCDNKEPMVDNTFGTKNNKIRVKATDFEVFEALDVDSRDLEPDPRARASSPVGDYGQVYPSKGSLLSQAPPILPAHLLPVMLNKEVAQHCEPSLLPEPNHVMLNHMYALSIKEGIMVLSTIHRYRKKYITSLLYKPT